MKRLIVLVLMLLAPAWCYCPMQPAIASGYPGVACIGGIVQTNEAHFNLNERTYMIGGDALTALLLWTGDDIWVGYPQGWVAPLGDIVLVVQLSRQGYYGGEVEFYAPPDFPAEYFVLPYRSTRPYADENGRHWGKHPACAFRMQRSVVDAWVAEVMD